MAIDSAAKRRSAGGVGFFVLGPGVTPDPTRGLAWRQQAAWGYSGLAAGASVARSAFHGYPSWQGPVISIVTASLAFLVWLLREGSV